MTVLWVNLFIILKPFLKTTRWGDLVWWELNNGSLERVYERCAARRIKDVIGIYGVGEQLPD
jgi:hypothetical protein